jgi:hypothetical protein
MAEGFSKQKHLFFDGKTRYFLGEDYLSVMISVFGTSTNTRLFALIHMHAKICVVLGFMVTIITSFY